MSPALTLRRFKVIHIFSFTKGDDTLTMAYTTEGVAAMDTLAPLNDGWHYDSIIDIPKLDESYDSVKTLWQGAVDGGVYGKGSN